MPRDFAAAKEDPRAPLATSTPAGGAAACGPAAFVAFVNRLGRRIGYSARHD